MKKSFPGHFANEPDDLKRLWEDSVIALDANVLLNMYRYSEGTRREFLGVFEKLKDRLWISHQVAKEYLKNRLKVISDQAKTYDAAIKGLLELREKFEDPKQHPFVSPEVLGDCTRSFDLIIGELRANKGHHDKKINDDDVKEAVAQIFDGKVGKPYQDEELEKLIVSGAERYLNKIPPGYKDADKKGGQSLEERLSPYGDYIGWRQLLDKALSDNCNVIFVTGDNKEDWWLHQSGRTIGPQPALIEEFVGLTTRRFYMYSPDGFLQQAGSFLRKEVSTQAMEEARRVGEEEVVLATESKADSKLFATWFNQSRKLSSALGLKTTQVAMPHISTLHGDSLSSSITSLSHRLEALQWRVVQLEAETAQRLIGDPSEEFSHLDNALVERHLDEVRLELQETKQMIDALKVIQASSDNG
ncbi:PIN-like domain-containing protein [Pseudomonas sp. MN1F]|uniref:PIN-like domain-containing protein n=1 Tax=Pseudomonas sp. MN1F TaxID=1366632 RepID=UPI00128F6BD8|nr:PIN domain-containing protein [Pseudomonas sp. MN1F]MQG94464.1 hypothetical protein [Pseudomonas sp. MN1F]